jgi:hypothetical protein
MLPYFHMSYTKTIRALSQNDAIEMMKDVFRLDYFAAFEFNPGANSISSDIIRVDSIGGYRAKTKELYKVGDISETVVALLDRIQIKGALFSASFQMKPTDEKLRAMRFEEEVYANKLSLPICFEISKDAIHSDARYSFHVLQLGFRSSRPVNEIEIKDEALKLRIWYAEISKYMEMILPK